MKSINRLLSISEMAQIHDISRQTLIYYDKIGLFQPDYVDEETGYRYYSTMQIPLLREICFLRSIGMPLDEIRQHNEINNATTSIELLESQNEKIKKKLADLQFQQQQIEKRVNIYRNSGSNYASDEYKPYIEHFPERKLLFYPWNPNEHTRYELHYTLMKIWNVSEKFGYLPNHRWGAVIFKESIDSGNPLYGAGGCMIAENPLYQEMPIEDPAKIITLSENDYACIPKFGMPYDTGHIYKLLKWISDNHYEITGDIYDECLLDSIIYGDDDALDFCELQVPIRKAN